MFDKLTDFALVRSPKQAMGFYLAWFIVVAAGVTLVLMSTRSVSVEQKYNLGGLLYLLSCTALAVLIVKAKSLRHLGYYASIAATAMLAYKGGDLLGMLIPAWLTTRPKGEV